MKAAISRAVCVYTRLSIGRAFTVCHEVLQKFMTGLEETVHICFQRMSEILRK